VQENKLGQKMDIEPYFTQEYITWLNVIHNLLPVAYCTLHFTEQLYLYDTSVTVQRNQTDFTTQSKIHFVVKFSDKVLKKLNESFK